MMYARLGRTGAFIGSWCRSNGRRDRWVVATKVVLQALEDIHARRKIPAP